MSKRNVLWMALAAAVWLLPRGAHSADYPSWWLSRGVINTNAGVTNDYASANAGQVKWFATNAYDELEANLPGGAGTNVEAAISGFSSTNNYFSVNAGQLKNLAKSFYDRLIEEGYTNSYPWTSTTTDDVSYAAAAIGQLKNIFSFDLTEDSDVDGLADWRETGTGVYVGPYNTGSSATNSDTDGDTLSDGAEVSARTDPNTGDTNKPSATISVPADNANWVRMP